jgi:hypothetical protein
MPFEHPDINTVDENFEWTSFDGRKTKFKNMDPTYLANIYKYFSDVVIRLPSGHGIWFLHLMTIVDRVRRRKGVSDAFMNGAPYPHVFKGEWKTFEFGTGLQGYNPKQATEEEFLKDITK